MESRYALREMQGAVGHDCRRLDDGRRAVFRHTKFHMAARRTIAERSDLITLLCCCAISDSCIASHPGVNLREASDSLVFVRQNLAKAIFPYEDIDRLSKGQSFTDDEIFDELEAYQKAEKEKTEKEKAENANPGGTPVVQ